MKAPILAMTTLLALGPWLIAGAARAQELGAWEIRADLPTARQEVGVGSLGAKIYVVGGFDSNGLSVPTVERYDPQTDVWEQLDDLPLPLNHVGVAAADGFLFAVGGLTRSFQAVAAVFAYDPRTEAWTTRAPLPAARGAMGVAEVEGLIYAAGGSPVARSKDFSVYDPGADEWTSLQPMLFGRNHLAAAEAGGNFYAIGGRLGATLEPALEQYDPLSASWTTREPLPTPRGGIAAAGLGGRIYVFGGEGNPSHPLGIFEEVEEFDPQSGSWRALAPMALARHGIGAAAYEGSIYLPGGGPVEGFGVTAHHDAFIPPPIASSSVRDWHRYGHDRETGR